MADDHKDCLCCSGNCPEINCVPTRPCCGYSVPTTPPKCVRPMPTNRTTCPTGNRYGCENLMPVCRVEPDTFTADQVAVIERTLVSALVYFPMYSVMDTFGCSCIYRPYYGREEVNCFITQSGGYISGALGPACSKPLDKKDCGCGCNDGNGLLRFWNPTTPDPCCPKMVPTIDENGEPVLDDEGNPLFSQVPQQALFGIVEPSHPNFTKYGGTPQAYIDFDHIMPATMAKIVGLFCNLICAFQKGGPSVEAPKAKA